MLKRDLGSSTIGTPVPTLFNTYQHSLDPRHMRHNHGRSPKGQSPCPLEKELLMKHCFKFLEEWTRGHCCRLGSIRANIRERIKYGYPLPISFLAVQTHWSLKTYLRDWTRPRILPISLRPLKNLYKNWTGITHICIFGSHQRRTNQ